MNTLVTGATGFVGRLLVSRLAGAGGGGPGTPGRASPRASGERIAALLLPGEPVPEEFSGRVEILRGDLRDPASIRAAVAGRDRVFHLAAYISYWRRDADLMRAVNRDGVAALVDACLEARVGRLVHVSSVGAIGFRPDGSPAAEDEPFNWPEDFAYMTTKRDGQRLVLDAVRERGLDAVVVNPASIMGPGDPVPTTAHNRLYGDMYSRPFFFGTFAGGLAIVDVRDLVAVIVAAAERGRAGECYLAVGANVPYSRVLELMAARAGKPFVPFVAPPALLRLAGRAAEAVSALTGKRPLLTEAYGRLSGWTAYYSAEKSRRELGATYRSLEETIGDACGYYEEAFLRRKGAR